MTNTKRRSEKKVICVNADEETLKILSLVKNKSEFIRDAIKDKFLYEKFKEEYIKLKNEIEKLKIENEKLKKTKNVDDITEEKEKKTEKQPHKAYKSYERNEIMMQKEKEKTKNLSEQDIIKCAREIYNKYKNHHASAIKITEKYLKKLGVKNPEAIINKLINQ